MSQPASKPTLGTSTILSALKTTTQVNSGQTMDNFRIDLNKKPIFELILDALAHNRTFINLNQNVHARKKVNLFPDFYDNYDYEGKSPRLAPAATGLEYDGSVVVDSNSSNIFGDYDGSQASASSSSPVSQDQNNSIFGQFSTPIMYIICMLSLYAIIIFVVFISALYSHRKRVGYNFDETLDGESASTLDELDSNVQYKSFYDDENEESSHAEKHMTAKRSLKSNRIKRKKPNRKRSRHMNSKAPLDFSKHDDEENKQLVHDGVNSEPEIDEHMDLYLTRAFEADTSRACVEDECVAKNRKYIKLISTPPKQDAQIYAGSDLASNHNETTYSAEEIKTRFHGEQPASLTMFERLFKLLSNNNNNKMTSLTKDHSKSTDRAGFSLLSSSELSKVHSLQVDSAQFVQDQKSWLNECKF